MNEPGAADPPLPSRSPSWLPRIELPQLVPFEPLCLCPDTEVWWTVEGDRIRCGACGRMLLRSDDLKENPDGLDEHRGKLDWHYIKDPERHEKKPDKGGIRWHCVDCSKKAEKPVMHSSRTKPEGDGGTWTTERCRRWCEAKSTCVSSNVICGCFRKRPAHEMKPCVLCGGDTAPQGPSTSSSRACAGGAMIRLGGLHSVPIACLVVQLRNNQTFCERYSIQELPPVSMDPPPLLRSWSCSSTSNTESLVGTNSIDLPSSRCALKALKNRSAAGLLEKVDDVVVLPVSDKPPSAWSLASALVSGAALSAVILLFIDRR